MRKKLPLISGILNVLEKLKGNTGIIENTDVAVHTIAAGKYVIWKNDLYKASSAISIGDTLSLSNLTAVSDGIANELNSKFTEHLSGGQIDISSYKSTPYVCPCDGYARVSTSGESIILADSETSSGGTTIVASSGVTISTFVRKGSRLVASSGSSHRFIPLV